MTDPFNAVRVLTTDHWRQKHAHCGGTLREPFPHHPDGSWFWLVCACGARHLTMTAIADEATR